LSRQIASFLYPFFRTLIFMVLMPLSASAEPGNAITIQSTKIDAFSPNATDVKIFGKLEFLGGLVLTSDDEDFGGFSGIRYIDAAKFIAISDQGKWLTGEITREGTKPTGITAPRMGRLRDASGKKMNGKKRADSEGIEIIEDEFLISFERNHRVERFKFEKNKLVSQSKKPVFSLNDIGLSNNKGPEGVALGPNDGPLAGTILTFPENAFDENDNLRAFMFKDKKRTEFKITYSNGFSLTDADFLPNGDLVVLERGFSLIAGVAMRIRQFKASEIVANAVLNGEVLMSANWDYEIDNMEGLSASLMRDGTTRLTIISDDNFSKNQRNLLLEFKILQ